MRICDAAQKNKLVFNNSDKWPRIPGLFFTLGFH